MKTIGLLGGMSWESTSNYYAAINRGIQQKLGGLHSARVAMVSVDFSDIETLQANAQWDEAGDSLARAAQQVEAAGADFLLICTNTMHKVASRIAAHINIPLLHIADATGQVLAEQGIRRIGLLGTRFTMEQAFYRERLEQGFDMEVMVPDDSAQETVHRIIYEELCLGQINDASRAAYLKIIDDLAAQGAEGVILGCTEIAMLVKPEHTSVRCFDTTAIHAEAAVNMALA